MKAKIIAIISKEYTILDEANQYHKAILAGKLRLDKKPVVGDDVNYIISEDKYVIDKILDRQSYLYRPNLANVDNAFIMMSIKEPDFSYELVNRLIFIIEYANVRPIIWISKIDLGDEEKIKEIKDYYTNMHYEVILGDDIHNRSLFKDKLSVLCGQSGVGKSTMLNRLIPDLSLKTNQISKALGRGKHTTRHVELYEVYDGLLADSPGFSSLDVSHIDYRLLASSISAFKPYINECRFLDCIHMNEPDCSLKKAVDEGKIAQSFYKTYLDIINFIKDKNYALNRHRTLK